MADQNGFFDGLLFEVSDADCGESLVLEKPFSDIIAPVFPNVYLRICRSSESDG